MNRSALKRVELQAPVEPNKSRMGFALANATNSYTLLTPSDGETVVL